jgi:hypothetical protein
VRRRSVGIGFAAAIRPQVPHARIDSTAAAAGQPRLRELGREAAGADLLGNADGGHVFQAGRAGRRMLFHVEYRLHGQGLGIEIDAGQRAIVVDRPA